MASLDELKKIACDKIEQTAGDLHDLSKAIWNKPELAFKEFSAHDVLCDFLKKQGFPVEPKYKLDTAFRAVHGSDEGPHVAVICEYDALPEIGHACGHNLIAEVGAGAGVGIKAALEAAEKAGKKLGKVTVFGTPAEEGGNGKALMIGAFQDIDCAMMSHPFKCSAQDGLLIAVTIANVKYSGKASHAAGAPWAGLNALDAVVMAYNNVSCLRQQMKPNWRVHGVITNGGAKPNIIPEEAAMQYYVRAPTMGELDVVKKKMACCFEAAAIATGCKLDLEWEPNPYENMITNKTLADLYDANGQKLGLELCTDSELLRMATGSTDMGNVSHVVPSIHPMFYIGTTAMNHTREFTVAAGADEAQGYTLIQAKALAMTALDVLYQHDLISKMKEEFELDLQKDKASA